MHRYIFFSIVILLSNCSSSNVIGKQISNTTGYGGGNSVMSKYDKVMNAKSSGVLNFDSKSSSDNIISKNSNYSMKGIFGDTLSNIVNSTPDTSLPGEIGKIPGSPSDAFSTGPSNSQETDMSFGTIKDAQNNDIMHGFIKNPITTNSTLIP